MTDLRSNPMTPSERVRVHATAWAILGDPHAADDVAQELALRLEASEDDVQPDLRGSWIARQAVGLSMNRRRGERRRARNEREAGMFRARRRVEPPEWAIEHDEDLCQVRSALADLEERQRLPLVLRYFHDRRLAEIASILGVPVSTAHERLQRGLSTMRGMLRRIDVAPALIGLALPRAAVVVAPTAAIGRASVLLGSGYWLARAAVLLATISLPPRAPGAGVAVGATELQVATAEPLEQVEHFPRTTLPPLLPPPVAPGPDVSNDPSSPLPPPTLDGDGLTGERVQPPVDSSAGTSGRASSSSSHSTPPVSGADPSVGRSTVLITGGDGSPPSELASGSVPRQGSSIGDSSSDDKGNGTGSNHDTGNNSVPDEEDDGFGSSESDGGSFGNGDGDDDGDDGGDADEPDRGSSRFIGPGSGPLQGLVSVGGVQPAGTLWVVLLGVVPDEADGERTFELEPLAAAATDELGRFHLRVPAELEEFTVQVGLLDEAGGFDPLPLRMGRLDPYGGIRLEVE